MNKARYIIFIAYFGRLFAAAQAQQSAYWNLDASYHAALELMEAKKYASAAKQFREAYQASVHRTQQDTFIAQRNVLKEYAQYYEAVCALALGNKDAKSLFLAFIKKYPESPLTKRAFFQIGKFYFQKGAYKTAAQWFAKVPTRSLNQEERLTYEYQQAYVYFKTNKLKEAQQLFAAIKDQKTPYSEDATYYFAYIAYLQKEYDTALKSFEQLQSKAKYKEIYPYYLVTLYFLKKHYDAVLSYGIPVIQHIPKERKERAQMLRIIAATYFAKADYPHALQYYKLFQDADRSRTQNSQGIYQIGYTYYKLKKYPEAISTLKGLVDTKDVYSQNGNYTLGILLLKVDDRQGARSAFQIAAQLSFDEKIREHALLEYAKLSYELGFNKEALRAARQFTLTYPQSNNINNAKSLVAEALLVTQNYQEAIELLQDISNKNEPVQRSYQKVCYYRALQFYNERAFQNAIGLFLQSLQYPVNPEITALSIYWMAESMFEVQKYAESIQNFEKFLQLPAAKKTDVYHFANYSLAYAAFNHGQYAQAAHYFKLFLQEQDQDTNIINDASLRLADCYFSLKSYEQALAYYQKTLFRHAAGKDYALFQIGMIYGIENELDKKIKTHTMLLQEFPNSNYAASVNFEIAYTHFLKKDYELAKEKLTDLMERYPQSSYVPKSLVTIGLVDYNQRRDELAIVSFKRVIQAYPASEEAQQALKHIEKIYIDQGAAQSFIDYAKTIPIGNYSLAKQDSILFNAAYSLYLQGAVQATVAAVNAYFDQHSKPLQEQAARFIRAESLVKLKQFDAAIVDYQHILSSSNNTYYEQSLVSLSQIYMGRGQYNEAVPFLKRLELNSEYQSNYTYAINNLLTCYDNMHIPDEVLKYVRLIRENSKSSEEDKYKTGLYAGKAYLQGDRIDLALKELHYTVNHTKTVAAAEALYLIAHIAYQQGHYKKAQKTCFDLIKSLANYDYWYAKTFILLADSYAALKDTFQAKSTLQSVIDNYKGKDDIIPLAKEKLKKLNTQATSNS